MPPYHSAAGRKLLLPLLGALLLSGCASPGPPRSPTLNLPAIPTTLTATRHGDTAEISLPLPRRNTDHLPLRGATLSVELCRLTTPAVCLPRQTFPIATPSATLRDTLPPTLATGAPHVLAYRVALYNDTNHTAGPSDPVYVAAGAPPPPVQALAAQGSRLGIILSFTPIPDDTAQILLRRQDTSPKPAKAPDPKPTSSSPFHPTATRLNPDDDPSLTWLSVPAATATVLDDTALPNEPYQYTAQRRIQLTLGGRTLELRSDPSPPISITLQTIYPPPIPTDLTAASYAGPTPDTLAVDLIWQPVDDPHLAGYNLYRQPLNAITPPTRLNATPIALPGFHDQIPTGTQFRYGVTAVDTHGNESRPTTFTIP